MPASKLRQKPITSNFFPENKVNYFHGKLGLLTSHARVQLCISHDPGMRRLGSPQREHGQDTHPGDPAKAGGAKLGPGRSASHEGRMGVMVGRRAAQRPPLLQAFEASLQPANRTAALATI
jgi:hypothetical protein